MTTTLLINKRFETQATKQNSTPIQKSNLKIL